MPPAPDTALPAGTWVADPARSRVGFSVAHPGGGTLRCRFGAFDAELVVGEDGSAALAGTAEAASAEVPDPALAAQVRAADPLDARRHPRLRFESTQLQLDGDAVEVDGWLTIRERTLAVTSRGTLAAAHAGPEGAACLGLSLATVVDRRQFGLGWGPPAAGGAEVALGYEVTIRADLVLVGRL